MSVTIILNPYSGRGKGHKIRPLLESTLRTARMNFDLVETSGSGEAIQLARSAKEQGAEVVVAVGGDGTINEVVNGLMQAAGQAAAAGLLAVLPIGTGNDFASVVGQRPITTVTPATQQQLETLVRAIEQRKHRLIDVGWGRVQSGEQIIERYFDNSMAAGLEAQAGIYSNRISGLPPKAIYTLAAIQAILAYRAPDVQLRWRDDSGIDKTLTQRSLMVSLGNTHRTGGGFLITPDARFDDGQLDVAVVRTQSRLALLALLPRAMIGKHTSHPAVTMLRTEKLEIRSSEGLPVHMDGEIVAERANTIEVHILPARLAVIG